MNNLAPQRAATSAPAVAPPPEHVRMEGITKRFGPFVALDDVTLTVGRGRLMTLLGPSGCGKTTLLRTVAGFLRQDAGSIRVGGRAIDDLPAHRRDFGMVFQSYAVFPHMSVRDNVAYGLKARSVPRRERAERVARALEGVQLGALADRFPDALSGGQKQRVGLARAMVIEPELLLMDEPLSNLDAKLRIDMRQEIRLIQRELGITTLYVTHDQEEAMAISDEVAVMKAGALQQVGPPEEIFENPANAFVADFIGGCNWFDATLDERGETLTLPGEPPVTLGRRVVADDRAVRLALRVDDLAAGDAAAPGLSASVLVRSYLGSRTRLRLRHAGTGTPFDVDLPSRPDLPGEGETVRLSFAPGRIRLFAAADGRRLL